MQKEYPDKYTISELPTENPNAGTAMLWRTPKGWVEKLADGTVKALTPEPEVQEIRIGETTGVISWPANFTPANTDGVAIARAKEVSTVTTSATHTLGGATDYESASSLPAALRGLDLVLRFAFPKNAPSGSAFQALIQTAGNNAVQISGSASGTDWTESTFAGTTTRIDYKGWIVYSVAFRAPAVAVGGPFSLYFVCSPGRVALPCIYKPADLPVAGTVDGMRLTDKATGGVVDYKLSDLAAANKAIAANKTAVDTAATDIAALTTRVGVLEKLDYNLENYSLDNGKLYTVTEAIGLNSLVHIRTDGKAELASDKDINKPADGIVLNAVAANSTTKIYSTGARIADLGQTGSLIGSRFYTGTSGAISTSATGSGRLIQEVAVFNGSTYLLSFVDRGYWVA